MPTVIFKPTEQCNARCTYCDVVKQTELKTMSIETLELVFSRINDYLEEYPEKEFEFVWHGGEPLLLKDEFFEAAIRCMETTCARTKDRIRHCIQTNLTLIQPKHIDFFRRLGINSVGTSYEPIHGIRGIGKKINSELYNERFFHGISMLENHDISWGFIYVVTKKSLEDPEGLWYTLTNLKPDGGFMMNAVLLYDNEDDGIGITPMEYVEFLGRLFPLWWKHRDRWPSVDPFAALLKNAYGSDDLGCVDSGGCGYAHLYIGPEGQSSQCGRSADWGIIDYGNIRERSVKEIMEDPKRKMFFERQDYLMDHDCKDCRFWKVCHGGCPLDAWDPKVQNFDRKTMWCALRSVFIEKYFEPITGLKFNAYADAHH